MVRPFHTLTHVSEGDMSRWLAGAPLVGLPISVPEGSGVSACADLLTTDSLREWTTDAQIVRFLKATGCELNAGYTIRGRPTWTPDTSRTSTHWIPLPLLQSPCISLRWDLSKSTHRLRDTLQWRAKLGDKKTCSLCERNPHAHNLYQCGFDKAGSPVIYSVRAGCDGVGGSFACRLISQQEERKGRIRDCSGPVGSSVSVQRRKNCRIGTRLG